MKELLSHFFLPRESNNHRSKLLHHQTIFLTILLFFVTALGLAYVRNTFPSVLGTAINISEQELLSLTNEERIADGREPLVMNEQLKKAALEKAKDMLTKNYWAHYAPDGTTPWSFIKGQGYAYVYAGENLARGFSTSEEVINAWMASSSHRENMLSNRYREVGFAIMDGSLVGEKTTLVVEMFGNTTMDITQKTKPQTKEQKASEENPLVAAAESKPFINSIPFVKLIGIGTVSIFLIVLVLDMFIVEQKRIVRFVGHNVDHIIFLSCILLLVMLINSGIIL